MRFDVKGLAKDHYVVINLGATPALLKVKDVDVDNQTVNFGSLTVHADSLDVLDYSYNVRDILIKYSTVEVLIDGDYMSLGTSKRLNELVYMIENGVKVMALRK